MYIKKTYYINDTKLMHRNRNKMRKNVFIYEDMKNIVQNKGQSFSEFCFAVVTMAIEKMENRKLPYIKNSDRLILNKIRMCISSNT